MQLLLIRLPAQQTSSVNGYFGSFSTSVPIAVPRFRGLEPKLSLEYDSAARNGWVGVGWRLNGLSFIERRQPGGGMPKYDSSDAYFMDGVELVSYAGFGGTHATKLANYTRISYDSQQNQWTATGTNGFVATYLPKVPWTSQPTFRWYLSTVVDTNGNTVTYNYTQYTSPSAQGAVDVILWQVAYNGVSIEFFPEEPFPTARPDPVTYAIGAYNRWGRIEQRLGAIKVTVNGQMARAYDLTYLQAPGTNRSLLQSVRQYDKNAVLSGGQVTSGNQLPPMTMTYHSPSTNLTHNTSPNNSQWGSDLRTWATDFTGDGMADLGSALGQFVYVKTSQGTVFSEAAWPTGQFAIGNHPADELWVADFNGDGKTDIAARETPTNIKMFLSQGGGFLEENWAINNNWGLMSETWAADFDGDGRADIASRIGASVYVNLSKQVMSGGGPVNVFNTSVWAALGTWGPSNLIRLGDFNGDGKVDIASTQANGSSVLMHLSTGTGWQSASWSLGSSATLLSDPSYFRVGDFNGDGMTDFVSMYAIPSVSQTQINYYMSAGNAASGFSSYSTNAQFYFEHSPATWVGDFNGDGKSDIVGRFDGTQEVKFLLTKEQGQGFDLRPQADPNPWGHRTYCRVADFNGDSRADIASPMASTTELRYSPGDTWGEPVDVAISVDNGIGSHTDLNYAYSSHWANHYLPVGVTLPAVRQMVTYSSPGVPGAITDYTYLGGKWSDATRRFLGFEKVTSLLNSSWTTETVYVQDEKTWAKPASTCFRVGTNKYTETAFTYYPTVSLGGGTAPPYASMLHYRDDYTYNGTVNSRQIRTEYNYDMYGNVNTTTEHGDFSVTGDERFTFRSYNWNTQTYVVGLPAYEFKYAGTSQSAPLVAAAVYYYDGSTNYQTPPTRGNRTRIDKWCDVASSWAIASMAYDSYGNITSETDERGGVATTTFDPQYHVFPLTVTNAMGHQTTSTWDYTLGVALSIMEPNGAVTSKGYDGFGRLTSITYPNLSTETTQYLNWSSPTLRCVRRSVPDGSADGLWTETYTDGLGRVYKTLKEGLTAGNPVRVDREFWFGTQRVKRESLPYRPGQTIQYIQYGFDFAGRPSYTIYPDNSYLQIQYGMEQVTNQPYEEYTRLVSGTTTTTSTRVWRDAYGNLAKVRETLNGQSLFTFYQYDALNRLAQVTDAQGHVSLCVYDSLGRKVAGQDPDLGLWFYMYDMAGNLTHQLDARGQLITFDYDALNRMTLKTYPDGTNCKWMYDEAGHGSSLGRLTTSIYKTGDESRTYDARGLITANSWTSEGATMNASCTYDVMGRPSQMTYPAGDVITYAYDNEGSLATASGLVTNMTWTASGQVASIDYANGTRADYTYDPGRLWLTNAQVHQGPTLLFDSTFTYDKAARVTSETSTTNGLRNRSYTYDDLDRLTAVAGAAAETFAYDSIGNMTSSSSKGAYTYGNSGHVHAPDSVGGKAVSYDACGNVLNDGKRTFSWDFDNRLLSVTAASTTSFAYDDKGGRTSKTDASGNIELYFGGIASLAQGVLTQYYAVNGMLVAKGSPTSKQFLHCDRLNSVVMATNGTGVVAAQADYSAYGAVISAGLAPAPFTFGSHWTDTPDLVCMSARYFDPSLGRFLQPDTVVPGATNPQSLNRYSYGRNNPVGNLDPTGHAPVAVAVMMAMVIASTTTSTLVAAAAILGAGLTIAGYFTGDPYLSAAGSILMGLASAGILGGVSAAAQSSLSPLDKNTKVAIGWAFTLAGDIDANGCKWETVGSSTLHYAESTAARVGVSKMSAHFGINQDYLTAGLMVASFAGNLIVGSRLKCDQDGGQGSYNFIEGVLMRGSGHGQLGTGDFWSGAVDLGILLAFDVPDCILAWQGLPTATAFEFVSAGNTSRSLTLVGHSLGAMDVNNLVGWGVPDTATMWSAPFLTIGHPGISVYCGTRDPINLWSIGGWTNPGSSMPSHGHMLDDYRFDGHAWR